MIKIIFLYIDGVLNTKYWYSQMDRNAPKDQYGYGFDPKSVANLAQIIEKTGAEIVISSSWKELGLSELRNMWKERKLPGKIIDVTPNYMSDEILLNADFNDTDLDHLYIRGYEIKGWLKIHGADVSHYVIIDDMDDVLPEQQSYLVQTDPEIGISDWDAKMAIMILNHLKYDKEDIGNS